MTDPTRLAGASILALLAASCGAAGLQRHVYERPAMGTTFRVVLYAADPATAGHAAERAFARIEALDEALSDWDPTSELSRLSDRAAEGATGPVPVSEDLFRVLERAGSVSAATGGAFDVTVGAAVRLWRRAARQEELPGPGELGAARASVGWRGVELDGEGRTVRLTRPGVRLDLGGIGKGYALDAALEAMAELGVTRALVDGGGDVAVGAPPPDRPGWRVAVGTTRGGVERPEVVLLLAHAACATSGDLYQRFTIDGVDYSHVIDPHTGLGSTRGAAATVVAPSGTEADAWASALCVLGAERGLELVEERPGLEARVAESKDGAGPCQSSGFARMMVEP